MADTLSDRALNRSLLARQLLLERETRTAADTIEHLVGMQAQNPTDPYYALWARLDGFIPHELEALLTERRAVRCWPMRKTVHLLTAEDAHTLLPLTRGVSERAFRSSFAKGLTGFDVDEIVSVARKLADEEPRTRPDLGRALHERWPDADLQSLGYAAAQLLPMVQLPPRGLWSETGPAALTTAENWLGHDLETDPSPDDVVLRYLAAFGPASNPDIRTWSGLTGVQEVTRRLEPQLRTFKDVNGRKLFDLPDAPLPDPDTPAPPRFLPELDNVFLSHDDRGRIVGPEVGWVGRITVERAMNKLLIDGLVCAEWALTGPGGDAPSGAAPGGGSPAGDAPSDDGTAVLTVRPYRPLTPTEVDEVTAEGARLLDLVVPGAAHDIRFTEPDPPGRARSWNPE